MILEHESARRVAWSRPAVDCDLAGCGFEQAADELQQSGLTAAARADDTQELVALGGECDVSQCGHTAVLSGVGLGQVAAFETHGGD